ncbi:MAG: HEAT repeat domain-containing protein [Gemmatimonadota bacterium]|nr:HEAT repeat domain-containing protein [Gemmatimonadota bacterium]MDH5282823.1 HEAT repeat domain-containing protein [Gemmatimonadota bacterium]
MRTPLLAGALFGAWAIGARATPPRPDAAVPVAGLDSAAVAQFLSGLGASDPAVCALAIDFLGAGIYRARDDATIAALRGQPANAQELRQRLSRGVTSPGAVRRLGDELRAPSACVRRTAAILLGESEATSARAALRTALGAEDATVREAAALGLGIAADSADVARLRAALADRDPGVVRLAAWALGRAGPAPATRELVALLQSPDPGVRRAAAWALGQQG